MSKFALQSLVLSLLAMDSIATAAWTDGGKLTGHNLGYCLPLYVESDEEKNINAGLGLGLGYTYYEEDSSFWTGWRNQMTGCAGVYFAGDLKFTDPQPGFEASTFSGNFLDFSYMPFGFTLLPGKYYSPGLWGLLIGAPIPTIYASVGLTGHIQQLQEHLHIYVNETQGFVEEENEGSTLRIFAGPKVLLGATYRLYLIDLFGEYHLAYLLDSSGGVRVGFTAFAGLGVSFVN